MASAERIFQALDWPEQIREPSVPFKPSGRLKGELAFRGLNFGYQANQPVLRDFTLTIKPGETLAVVGPTGSGKSTLIRLLVRFYDVNDGMIFIDGEDINRYGSSVLRQRIGVVLQDFHIFSGSILENIRLGNPAISRADAIRAADAVQATPFIERLPEGFDTHLNERGQTYRRESGNYWRLPESWSPTLRYSCSTRRLRASILKPKRSFSRHWKPSCKAERPSSLLTDYRRSGRPIESWYSNTGKYGKSDDMRSSWQQKGIYYTLSQLQFQEVIQ